MTMNEGQDLLGQQLPDQDLPLDETGLEQGGAAAPEEQAPAWFARYQRETQETIRAAQGQASRAERRVGELQNLLLQRAAAPEPPPPDPFDGIDLETYDPAMKAVISSQRLANAQLQRLANERQQEQARSDAKQYFDNTMNEVREAADIAGVDFAAIEPGLKGIGDANELWAEGKKLIRAAKQVPARDNTRQERRAVEAEQGIYTERRAGSTGRGSQKPSDLRDAYGDGRISSSQYEAGMKQLGLEP